MKTQRYVIVDTRTICGNSVMFWCWDGCGYTVDLRMAAIFTKEEAEKICKNRDTDKMYTYSNILKLVQHHVDIQDLRKIGIRKNSHTFSHLKVNP